MQCGVCEQDHTRLHCVHCTQKSLWKLRTEYLFAVTERDGATERVEEYLESQPVALVASTRRGELQERIRIAREEAQRLREANRTNRTRLAILQRDVEERKIRLEMHRRLAQKQDRAVDSLQREIRKKNEQMAVLAVRTAEARSFLCREAAGLCSLWQKRKRNDTYQYIIGGGVQIPNLLQDLNTLGIETINTSISQVCRLVMLIAHYIGLKLPYEIILPARGSPYPSIQGAHHSRHLTVRPLHLDKPLLELSLDNSGAVQHAKYAEGISMLAYNIAYICYTQGLPINDVGEACNIGKCLVQLLTAKNCTAATNPAFGKLSDATIAGNIATVEGRRSIAGFTLGYKAILERVRNTLQGETIVADWDLVSDAETELKSPVGKGGQEEGSEAGSTGRRGSTATGNSNADRWTRIRIRPEGEQRDK